MLQSLDSEGMLAVASHRLSPEHGSRLLALDKIVAPCIDSAMSWEGYEQALRASKRKQIHRKRRWLTEVGGLTYEALEGLQALQENLRNSYGSRVPDGRQIPDGDPHASKPSVSTTRSRHGGRPPSAPPFLRLDDRPVVGRVMIGDEAHRYVLKTRYVENGQILELGAGMNRMKEELHNAQRTIEHVALFPRSVGGALTARVVEVRQTAYRRTRESALLRRERDTVRKRLNPDAFSDPGRLMPAPLA
jgi:hypothetical protein